MNTFAKYLPLSLVALTVLLFSWLGGGAFPAWIAWWTPWMTLLLVEVTLVLPEVKRNETLMQARVRVWRGIFRDPLLWFGILLTLFLVIQWLNGPRIKYLDPETRQWLFRPPPIPWLPSGIHQGEARCILDWFPPVIAAALTARHALLKPAKRMLCQFICWNAAVLSLAGLIQMKAGTNFLFTIWGYDPATVLFASFGYPNFAAAYFPAIMALSMGLWLWSVEHRESLHYPAHIMLIPVFFCGVGGVCSLSRAGVVFTIAVVVIGGFYAAARYWSGWSKAMRTRVSCATAALIIAVVACVTIPKSMPLRDELLKTDWKAFIEHPMLVRSGYQGEAAWEMYKDYPAYGLGGWGYSQMIHLYVKPEDVKALKGLGQANVHNDTLQFLAEHGTIGFGLMLACALSLAIPFWIQLVKSPADALTEEQKARRWPFRINVLYIYAAFATGIIGLHSFIDIPFRSPACMIVFALCFAVAPGFAFQQPKAAAPQRQNRKSTEVTHA